MKKTKITKVKTVGRIFRIVKEDASWSRQTRSAVVDDRVAARS